MQDNDLKSLPHSLSALTRLEQLWVCISRPLIALLTCFEGE